MIDKLRHGFLEEARELLAELETALLELDRKPADLAIVDRAFRALHTIKGSGAMFGFENIASFVHNLESIFDQLRNGSLSATSELINLTLEAADQIKRMVDAADPQVHGLVEDERSACILEAIARITTTSEARGCHQVAPPDSPPGTPEGPVRE